jgi:nicotinate dehydrogenase subunit B
VQVVRKNNFLGVVAENEWDAIKAAQTLPVKWSDWTGLPTTEQVYDTIRNTKSTDKVVASKGDVTTALAAASKRVTATYQTPFETHGALGPSVAIGDVRNGEATIYTGSSGPHSTQTAVAQLLNLPVDKVHVIWHEAAGDYGTNGADPAAADAALMSQAVGKPVRVQWMRWDEHGWDPKGPAMVQDIHAGLDPAGQITGWNHEVWDPPDTDSLLIGSVLAGTPVGVEGLGGWSGPLLYNIANSQQLNHAEVNFGPHTKSAYGVITSFLRSPAQYQITFAMESFMDELAAADKADPVQFRLRYLTDQRMIDLLRATVERANWDYRPSPSTSASGTAEIATGRGVAISLRGGTYNAEVAFVQVNRKTGKVSVERFVVGQDNGLTINPRQVEIQIETCVVQTTSRAMLEEITFSNKAVTSLNWDTYPILRFLDAPRVETLLIDHPNLPATGVGEPSACPVAAAIANAIYDAVGVRMRTLPLREKSVKAALEAAAAKA